LNVIERVRGRKSRALRRRLFALLFALLFGFSAHGSVLFRFPRELPGKLLQTALQGIGLCLNHPWHLFGLFFFKVSETKKKIQGRAVFFFHERRLFGRKIIFQRD
jgi:hypothetical protein